MAREHKTTSIGGATWSLNTLPATTGTEILTQLVGMLGEGVSVASMEDLKTQSLPALIGTLLKSIGKPGTTDIIKALLGGLKKGTKDVVFDIEFAGNYGVLTQLVAWSIKENYASFFVDNPVLADLLSRAQAAQSQQQALISESGDPSSPASAH